MPASRNRRAPARRTSTDVVVGHVLHPADPTPSGAVPIEVTVTPTEPEDDWQMVDPVFWDAVEAVGPPRLRHRIDMVMTRGPIQADMPSRVVTMFDATED